MSMLSLSVLAACAQTEIPTLETSAGLAAEDDSQQTASLPSKSEHVTQPLPTLRDMIGLDRDQITALFGTPHFRRLDKPADLWQFSNKKCALDLFLYRIRDGNIFKVTHAEVRILNKVKVTKTACFETLIKNHINQAQSKRSG